MNDLAIGKSKLQDALLEVSKKYLENLELAPEEAVSYSPKLERKMSRLLKLQRKPYRNLINAPYKKAIAACLAIIIFAGALMSCKPIREPVIDFFTNVYEKFTEFFFGDENKDVSSKVITEIHTPTYVPEGYELVESPTLMGKDYKLCTIWKSNNDSKIIFYQSSLLLNTTLDTENAIVKVLSNNTNIAIVKKLKNTYIFWNDNNYSYTLIVDNVSDDEIEKIIKSIK